MSMNIKLARVDKRLLHATVALNWNQFVDADYVLVVDPNYSADPFIEKVLQLSLPKSMRVKMLDIDNLIEFLEENSKFHSKAMVIFSDLDTASKAIAAGFSVKELQLPSPASRIMIKKLSDYFNQEEINAIRFIQSKNIKLFFQTSPFDAKEYSAFLK